MKNKQLTEAHQVHSRDDGTFADLVSTGVDGFMSRPTKLAELEVTIEIIGDKARIQKPEENPAES